MGGNDRKIRGHIKKAIKDYLDVLKMQGKLYHFPVLQGLGAHKGVPDRIILLPRSSLISASRLVMTRVRRTRARSSETRA